LHDHLLVQGISDRRGPAGDIYLPEGVKNKRENEKRNARKSQPLHIVHLISREMGAVLKDATTNCRVANAVGFWTFGGTVTYSRFFAVNGRF
jgi:hypothetical protein